MIVGTQQLCRLGILQRGTDLPAHELRCGFVGVFVDQQVGERVQKTDAAALGPFCLVGASPLLLGCIERGLYRRRIPGDPEWRIEGGASALGILRFVSALFIGIHWRIACGQAEVGCPLKDVKMLRLFCNDGYRLDARRAGSNHAYSQSGEIDSFMGP